MLTILGAVSFVALFVTSMLLIIHLIIENPIPQAYRDGRWDFWRASDRSFLDSYRESNKLYQCNSCDRYSRMWQIDFHKVCHRERVCIHCGDGFNLYRKGERDWMSKLPDCPKISRRDFYRLYNDMKSIQDSKKSQKDIDKIQEYLDKHKEVSYWIRKDYENKEEDN